MEAATELIRKVVRGFYDSKAVIVMDAILIHHVLSEKDLIQLMGLPAKNLRAICARLKEDHLIKEVSHKDDATREHRSYIQTYFYVHFTEAVDAIKWKIHSIQNKLKQEMDAQHNPQDYVCDTCKTRYKTLDAVNLFDPVSGAFECEVCKSPLREDDGPAPDDNAQDKMGELMVQLKPFIESLRKIDDLTIPENSFQHELQQAFPMPAEEQQEQVAVPLYEDLPTASNSRLPAAAQPVFTVDITTEAERSKQASLEAAEKKRLAEENALPSWHQQSTVAMQFQPATAAKAEVKAEQTEEKQEDNDEAMAAYYQKLQAQREQQQQQQVEEEEEDDDEDEFEDVL